MRFRAVQETRDIGERQQIEVVQHHSAWMVLDTGGKGEVF